MCLTLSHVHIPITTEKHVDWRLIWGMYKLNVLETIRKKNHHTYTHTLMHNLVCPICKEFHGLLHESLYHILLYITAQHAFTDALRFKTNDSFQWSPHVKFEWWYVWCVCKMFSTASCMACSWSCTVRTTWEQVLSCSSIVPSVSLAWF